MVSILLKLDQKVSAFSVLPSIDVLVLFPIGLGKSVIHRLFVIPKSRLISDVNKNAVAFVISPLKSIFGEQLKYFNDIMVPGMKLSIANGLNSMRDAEYHIY